MYTLSGVYYDNGSLFTIYRNVFIIFYGLGGGALKTIEKSVLGYTIASTLHLLSGRVYNAALSMEIKNSLRVFFEE